MEARVDELEAECDALNAENRELRAALNTMLDYYGEDEHNKATHDAARAALKEPK
jgi:hypothetical protein